MSTNRSKDRASLCSFMFVDGRRCRIPRVGHPYLCAFHARKEAQALAGKEAAEEINYHLSGNFISACDLSSALARLFSAVAQGQVKPKTASTLAYLGQTLVQALHLSQNEFVGAFGANYWRETVRNSYDQTVEHFSPASEPQSPDATEASDASSATLEEPPSNEVPVTASE